MHEVSGFGDRHVIPTSNPALMIPVSSRWDSIMRRISKLVTPLCGLIVSVYGECTCIIKMAERNVYFIHALQGEIGRGNAITKMTTHRICRAWGRYNPGRNY